MGVYVYGVTNTSRKVIGLDERVYCIKFLCKDTFSNWKWVKNIRSRYDHKDSMKGKLVAYDIGTSDAPEYLEIYRYKANRNSFTDGGDTNKILEKVCTALKTAGNRYTKIAEGV